MSLTKDTTCGFWIFKGKFFQRFANKNSYVVLYGIVGCTFAMSYAYFNGTITTIEKRFKIPSRNTGIISVGNDISQLILAAILSYYAGKGHRPRWIGFGLLTIVAFCLLTALPHFLYGPGEDSLKLTMEYGADLIMNGTQEAIEKEHAKYLCREKGQGCQKSEGNFAPQVVLFTAQFISGIGGSLYYTLGTSYMDDNTQKSKTPALLSLSYFMRMLGPAMGYALASFCLRIYIAPNLTPTITDKDPRWLGAWWMGWLIIGVLIFVSGIFLTMFPKELPKAAARREKKENKKNGEQEKPVASFADMKATFKRLITNKTYMFNNLSSIFYLFGYMPYWIFSAKYIETIYRQSAATSSLVTGTIALAFSAIGILGAGYVITRFKPSARKMAAWNVIVGFMTVAGISSYAFIGCPGNEQSVIVNIPKPGESTCISNCSCDYVPYTPVCGEDGYTYISPCHAGCTSEYIIGDKKKVFYNCSCVEGTSPDRPPLDLDMKLEKHATQGACPVNCYKQFVIFLSVMCLMKFIGSTGRASNFLVSVRCVPEDDKATAMGLGMMLMSLFAFIPSPIFFGWLMDSMCLVWGKTCTHKGNCWLYDPESLRYILNIVASAFVTLGALFDIGVWYYVKNLKIFDEENNNEDNITSATDNNNKSDMEMKGPAMDINGRLSISTITTASIVAGSEDEKEKERN
ncbi:hypothetical protein ACFFRR_007384 [Megaselia abdita]